MLYSDVILRIQPIRHLCFYFFNSSCITYIVNALFYSSLPTLSFCYDQLNLCWINCPLLHLALVQNTLPTLSYKLHLITNHFHSAISSNPDSLFLICISFRQNIFNITLKLSASRLKLSPSQLKTWYS